MIMTQAPQTIEQQTAEKTQAILEQQIGNLVLSCAKFRAEAEVLREQVKLLEALGPPPT